MFLNNFVNIIQGSSWS